MSDAGEIVLSTARLFFTRFIPDDAPFVVRLVTDPDWIRYIGDRGHWIRDRRCEWSSSPHFDLLEPPEAPRETSAIPLDSIYFEMRARLVPARNRH